MMTKRTNLDLEDDLTLALERLDNLTMIGGWIVQEDRKEFGHPGYADTCTALLSEMIDGVGAVRKLFDEMLEKRSAGQQAATA